MFGRGQNAVRPIFGAVIAALIAGSARAAPVSQTASLRCGAAVISARTVHDAHLPPDDAFGSLSQTLSLQAGPHELARSVRGGLGVEMRLPGGQDVAAAIVQSWSCVQRNFEKRSIILDIACQSDDAESFCAGQAERFALLSLNGELLDSGFSSRSVGTTSLYGRLGVRLDGVPMRDSTGP